MEKELAKNIQPGPERIAFLSDNCDKPSEKTYMKRFNQEQMSKMKDGLSKVDIEINDIEIEKKSAMEVFKLRLKPLQEERQKVLDGLRNKAELVTERCFKFIDYEAREVGYYNEEGDLIESRPAYANEMQGNLFVVAKTGTND